ncbi:MAG: MotA/TolQ/ExbB proton channel family protein [Verrucomicrobiae bacterium]|nr:MotA/TolQ/ExbB proton channel family protein [Verrucomicrobiae bacterium]
MAETTINEQVWSFLLSGGFFMIPIGICSFVGIAVCIHRGLTLKWKAVIPPELRPDLARIADLFRDGKASKLLLDLRRSDSPMGRIGRIALSQEFSTPGESERAVEATAREQMVKLENGMGVLEVVITIAPLLGLLGTVSGLVSVFATLGAGDDQTDPALIAGGIAEALNTTIAGLVVAVVMVIFHSYFTRRLERIAARMEVIAGHLIHEFHKHGGPSLYSPSLDSAVPEFPAVLPAPSEGEPFPAASHDLRP